MNECVPDVSELKSGSQRHHRGNTSLCHVGNVGLFKSSFHCLAHLELFISVQIFRKMVFWGTGGNSRAGTQTTKRRISVRVKRQTDRWTRCRFEGGNYGANAANHKRRRHALQRALENECVCEKMFERREREGLGLASSGIKKTISQRQMWHKRSRRWLCSTFITVLGKH